MNDIFYDSVWISFTKCKMHYCKMHCKLYSNTECSVIFKNVNSEVSLPKAKLKFHYLLAIWYRKICLAFPRVKIITIPTLGLLWEL